MVARFGLLVIGTLATVVTSEEQKDDQVRVLASLHQRKADLLSELHAIEKNLKTRQGSQEPAPPTTMDCTGAPPFKGPCGNQEGCKHYYPDLCDRLLECEYATELKIYCPGGGCRGPIPYACQNPTTIDCVASPANGPCHEEYGCYYSCEEGEGITCPYESELKIFCPNGGCRGDAMPYACQLGECIQPYEACGGDGKPPQKCCEGHQCTKQPWNTEAYCIPPVDHGDIDGGDSGQGYNPGNSKACSAHPTCAHLDGDCCPTSEGYRLSCCNES